MECDTKLKVMMEDEEDNLVEVDGECIMQVDINSIPSENIPDAAKQKLMFDKIMDEDQELEKENFPPDNKTAQKNKEAKIGEIGMYWFDKHILYGLQSDVLRMQ